jgi:hypothetical protein
VLVNTPRGEWSGQAERMRFARLTHQRGRAFWRTFGPRRLRRKLSLPWLPLTVLR